MLTANIQVFRSGDEMSGDMIDKLDTELKALKEVQARLEDVGGFIDIIGKQQAELLSLRAELDAERERNRWIPVEERLPEDNRNVLVCITEVDGSPVIDFGYYIPGDNVYEGWQTNYFMAFGKVTHWREMPAPPEAK